MKVFGLKAVGLSGMQYWERLTDLQTEGESISEYDPTQPCVIVAHEMDDAEFHALPEFQGY